MWGVNGCKSRSHCSSWSVRGGGDTERDHGPPHLREPLPGRHRVVRQDTAQPRRLDNADPWVRGELREPNVDGRDALAILGIVRFTDKIGHGIKSTLVPCPSQRGHPHLRLFANGQLGNDRRDGRHADRPDLHAGYMVEKGAFPRLAAAPDHDFQLRGRRQQWLAGLQRWRQGGQLGDRCHVPAMGRIRWGSGASGGPIGVGALRSVLVGVWLRAALPR